MDILHSFAPGVRSLLTVMLVAGMTGPVRADGNDLEAVVAKFNSLGSFKATVSFNGPSGSYKGVLSYQAGKIHFALNDGRVLASNGRQLVAYNPGSSVAAKQDMFPGGGGLDWLLSSNFKASISGSTAHLKSTKPDSGMKEVKVRWGEGHTLQQLSILYRKSEEWLTISISDMRSVQNLPASLFSYHPPSGSRTVDNPLNQSR